MAVDFERQSASRSPVKVYRWTPTDSVVSHSATRTFAKAESHVVTVHRENRNRDRTQEGFVDSETYRVIAWFTSAFHLGDRIGDGTSAVYEVVELRTYAGNQQMTVVPC